MPPTPRPIPRHIAEPPHELLPHGRWAEQLARRFLAACSEVETDEQLRSPEPDEIDWYPERTHAGRSYVPATAINADGVEFFGYVSFMVPEHSPEPKDFSVKADYTHETAESNPDWKIDLNEEVIARWRGPGETTADVTLVWGRPLVGNATVASGELDEQTVDQCAMVQESRFTIVALDAINGFGAYPIYLEIALWDKRNRELTRESLYEAPDPEESEVPASAEPGS